MPLITADKSLANKLIAPGDLRRHHGTDDRDGAASIQQQLTISLTRILSPVRSLKSGSSHRVQLRES